MRRERPKKWQKDKKKKKKGRPFACVSCSFAQNNYLFCHFSLFPREGSAPPRVGASSSWEALQLRQRHIGFGSRPWLFLGINSLCLNLPILRIGKIILFPRDLGMLNQRETSLFLKAETVLIAKQEKKKKKVWFQFIKMVFNFYFWWWQKACVKSAILRKTTRKTASKNSVLACGCVYRNYFKA